MVNWKTMDSAHRLIAAMVAANPNNKDYKSIAGFFGQGVTASSVEHQFRIFRKMADEMKAGTLDDETSTTPATTPRTPRNNKVTKPATPSSAKCGKGTVKSLATAGTSVSRKALEEKLMDPVGVNGNNEACPGDDATGIEPKQEKMEIEGVMPTIESPNSQPVVMSTSSMAGVVVPIKGENTFTGSNCENTFFIASTHSRRSLAPPRDSDGDFWVL
ncbi:hypothetical protein BDV18DRAFT_163730 [Aspergillus unguis]